MEAAIGTIPVGRAAGTVISAAMLRRWLAMVATSLVVMAAVLLTARRLAGALVEPLPGMVLVATGLLSVGAVALTRSLNRQAAAAWLLSIVLVLIAFTVSLPGSSWLAFTVLWLAVLGEEVWAWRPRRVDPTNHIDVAWRHLVEAPQIEPGDSAEFIALDRLALESAPADWTNSQFTQQLKYSRDATAGMSIEGWLRAEFVAGQRTAIVHAAFCPAFSRMPQVESEPLDGPDCEIRRTLTLPWGVRWEVKLNRAAKQSINVVLGFLATETTDP